MQAHSRICTESCTIYRARLRRCRIGPYSGHVRQNHCKPCHELVLRQSLHRLLVLRWRRIARTYPGSARRLRSRRWAAMWLPPR